MGVAAWRATTLEEFNSALAASLKHQGPSLIEALV
jgi:thiamine pyrophosphate-dependent acetolactate synthase large subunit-like protein